jgi:hypothetical protein
MFQIARKIRRNFVITLTLVRKNEKIALQSDLWGYFIVNKYAVCELLHYEVLYQL